MALSKIDVANMLTGSTPVANGGTGIASGTSGQFLKFTGSTTLASAAGGGITMCKQYRLTSDVSGDANPVTNWEKVDSDGYGDIGSDMSESSGTWTFPETGIYKIEFTSNHQHSGNDKLISSKINTTTDNSSYNEAAESYTNLYVHDNVNFTNNHCSFIFDVTNTTTHKFRIEIDSEQSSTFSLSSTNSNLTFITITRLGDT